MVSRCVHARQPQMVSTADIIAHYQVNIYLYVSRALSALGTLHTGTLTLSATNISN